MGEALNLLLVIACAAFPFIAMPLLWRRMKRVRNQAYSGSEAQSHEAPWREAVRTGDGLTLDHAHSPNEELIALGEKGKQGRWPLDNQ